MGLLSWTDEDLAAKVVSAGQSAWLEGHAVFIYRLMPGTSGKNDTGTLLTLAVSGLIEIGWRLHSLTPFISTLGPNREIVLLTVERPGGS